MTGTRTDEQRRELGEFVRAHREALAPGGIGLPAGGRRRTPGLRREEVAQLCGLSITWYTWIEQGRDVSASPGALARLAGVLRLGRAERAYLFQLAGKRDPEPTGGETGQVPAAVLACVQTIASPAYLLNRTWTAVSWNAPAEKLFVGWLDGKADRNLLRFIFLEPKARTLVRDWEARARRVAEEFRAASSAHLDDPELQQFIAELKQRSPEFAQFWARHGVLEREGGERTFNHPARGYLHYQQVTFDVASQPDLKLTILVQQKDRAAKPARKRKPR